MDDETRKLFEEIANLLQASRCESRALAELLIEKGVFSEDELDEVVERVRQREYVELKAEFLRRGFERDLKGRPKQ